MAVGHERQREVLEKDLPKVALFLGPKSVGKATVAREVLLSHGVRPDDTLEYSSISASDARDIGIASHYAPWGDKRAFILEIDGAAVGAMNILLKALEEAPDSTHFILIASRMPLPTILSRANVVHFSLLPAADVEQILLDRRFKPGEAKRLAELSNGQVYVALRHAASGSEKMLVLSAVRCITERDQEALSGLATRWTDEHTELLCTAAREALTGRWTLFADAELESMSRPLALKLLKGLNQRVRPRITVNAILMDILKGAE